MLRAADGESDAFHMTQSIENRSSSPVRTCALIAALVGCLFLWIALLSFDPLDPPGTLAWPANDPPANRCGPVGAWVAFQLDRFLGIGAFALAALLTSTAGTALLRGPMRDWPLRLVGGLLLIVATSAAGTMILGGPAQGRWTDGGGAIGIAAAWWLSQYLNTAGASLVLLASAGMGLVLAADEIVVQIARMSRRVVRMRRPALAGAAANDAGGDASDAGPPARGRSARNRPTAPSGQTEGTLARARQGLAQLIAIGSAARQRLAPRAAQPGANDTQQPRAARGNGATGTSTATSAGEADDANERTPRAARRRADAAAPDDANQSESLAATEEQDSPADAAAETVASAAPPTAAKVDARTAAPAAKPADAASGTSPRAEPVVRTFGAQDRGHKPPPNPWPKELGDYVLPPIELLDEPEYSFTQAQESVVRDKAAVLERTLQDFRLDARVVAIDTGPVITMYELSLAPGIKVSQIASLANDIARAMKAPAVRVVAPLPGKNTIGIEVPNIDKEKVRLKELIERSGVKATRMTLPMFLGKDASGNPLIADLSSMPHLLIAGTTGSGKSVCINTLVMSILMTQRPDHVKLILVDPKMVELSMFKEVPHLMCPIVTDMNKAEAILEWAATKMDERYELLAEAGVRQVGQFNRLGKEEIYRRFQPSNDDEKAQIPTYLPHVVIIIDELADLMLTSGKTVEHHLCRIAQKSRAVGIHVILATQRPQANVVTGLIKSNLPCRVAFRVASRMDSRIVLDQNGAEVLMGQGDMLFLPPGSSKLVRAQGTYVEDEELRRVLEDLRTKAQPEFHHELVRLRPMGEGDTGERDPLFDDAVRIVIETRRGSVSLLQRRLAIGYTRASRLIDQMAFAGIVGEHKGSQQREVLVTLDEWEAMRSQRDREIAEGGYAADEGAYDDDDDM